MVVGWVLDMDGGGGWVVVELIRVVVIMVVMILVVMVIRMVVILVVMVIRVVVIMVVDFGGLGKSGNDDTRVTSSMLQSFCNFLH